MFDQGALASQTLLNFEVRAKELASCFNSFSRPMPA
jgi:hypothetical protein